VRLQLASILTGIVSQRLIPRADGRGMIPAVEILINTHRIREMISEAHRGKEIVDATPEIPSESIRSCCMVSRYEPGVTESKLKRPIESAIVLLEPSVTNAAGNGRPERLSNVTPVTRTSV
jgi:hypothetical protein